jgi:CxxC motif-containing protein (DUF1111 family)
VEWYGRSYIARAIQNKVDSTLESEDSWSYATLRGEDLPMRQPSRASWIVGTIIAGSLCLAALTYIGWRVLTVVRFETDVVAAGRELFHHEWTANDSLCADGDGLGPVYNATSCVACHNQGGSGGSGSLNSNVTTVTVISDAAFPRKPEARERVVHSNATPLELRETLRDVHSSLPDHLNVPQSELVRLGHPRGVAVTQVNTPALFGLGLIDAVPDQVLVEEEKNQRSKWGEERDQGEVPIGRVSRLPGGRIGKFGWKAQTAALSDFVQAACANELGLGNPGHPQPVPLKKPDYKAPGLDLTQEQCDQITAYVASLPAPRERLPESFQGLADAPAGRELFTTIGCADCHKPNLGNIQGIYSDLLLHRMGSEMSGGVGYRGREFDAGNFALKESPEAREWRTPPLWGVADSAPYMHDGRAPDLEEAIETHGGQGERSAKRFKALKLREKMQLIAFLETLRAP